MEKALFMARISKVHHRKALHNSLSETETQIVILQKQRDQLRAELTTSTMGLTDEELRNEVAERVRPTHEKKLSVLSPSSDPSN